MHINHLRSTTTLLVLSAAALLAACGRDENRDSVSTTRSGTDATQTRVGEVAADTRDAAKSAADTATMAAKDTAITAEVKTRLAQDSQLSALDIQVETIEGRVQLRGTAPDTGARSHATELAQAVSGVVGVRNDLSVQVLSK